MAESGGHSEEGYGGKLATNWEGPFWIVEDLNNGAYRLEYLTG